MKHCAYLVVAVLLCSSGLARAEGGKNSTVKKTASGRIVGGYAVDISNYPYTVVVHAYTSATAYTSCGGIIIASKKVLTAAHCLYQRKIFLITIRAGSSIRISGGVLLNHQSYALHSQFNSTTFENDVAVITTQGTFEGFPNVGIINLQNTKPVISSVNPTACFVVGWGYINMDLELAHILQRANYVLVPQTTCASRLNPLTSTTICAQSIEGGACNGDSGGPLVCNNRLYGVVSYGPTYCNGAMPNGFAKITAPSIRSFITAHAGV